MVFLEILKNHLYFNNLSSLNYLSQHCVISCMSLLCSIQQAGRYSTGFFINGFLESVAIVKFQNGSSRSMTVPYSEDISDRLF